MYRGNGKEHGNYCNGIYRGFIRVLLLIFIGSSDMVDVERCCIFPRCFVFTCCCECVCVGGAVLQNAHAL